MGQNYMALNSNDCSIISIWKTKSNRSYIGTGYFLVFIFNMVILSQIYQGGQRQQTIGGNHATAQIGTIRYTNITHYHGLMAGRQRDVGGNR
jgi:hypothetical protein